MPVYNFQVAGPVPACLELIDIVLMRDSKETPTGAWLLRLH
jgi:hypothetical protein